MSDKKAKGFTGWRPTQQKIKARVEMVLTIFDDYADQVPLTLRQVFYIAVGQHGYDKTERAYGRLGDTIGKMRRGRLLPFSVIRDDGVTRIDPLGYNDLDDFQETLRRAARQYRRHRQIGQARKLMVLCEAAGMVPQLERVCDPYGIPVQSASGYDSITIKHELAEEVAEHDRPTTILHLGDLDPSGEDIFANIDDDAGTFAYQMLAAKENIANIINEIIESRYFDPVRLAITREQAEDMDLTTEPPKSTDSRSKNFEGDTVQLEAMPPDVIARILREAIEERMDLDIWRDNIVQEEVERERAIDVINSADWAA